MRNICWVKPNLVGHSLFSLAKRRLYLTLPTDLLKKQKADNNTSPPAQLQAPASKVPTGMRNFTTMASFPVPSHQFFLQLWTVPPRRTRALYSIHPSIRHLSPSVLKLPTSSTPSLLQSWATLLPKATRLRITTRLPHRRSPSIPSLLLHQNTPPLGPGCPATHYCLPIPTASSFHLLSL